QLPNKSQKEGQPLLISLYIPRAYRHALIAPCFHSVRFSTSHHIEVNFALFLILGFVALIGFSLTLLRWQNLLLTFIVASDKSKSESVLLSAIGLVAF
ncbi:uncharacterized protein N7487_002506, partial [Penicillium crustosum]|uniref:uncharacterized protein n=1 Tax=Penicillium crustosum TaxID=36656 RepID=UPI002397FD1A